MATSRTELLEIERRIDTQKRYDPEQTRAVLASATALLQSTSNRLRALTPTTTGKSTAASVISDRESIASNTPTNYNNISNSNNINNNYYKDDDNQSTAIAKSDHGDKQSAATAASIALARSRASLNRNQHHEIATNSNNYNGFSSSFSSVSSSHQQFHQSPPTPAAVASPRYHEQRRAHINALLARAGLPILDERDPITGQSRRASPKTPPRSNHPSQAESMHSARRGDHHNDDNDNRHSNKNFTQSNYNNDNDNGDYHQNINSNGRHSPLPPPPPIPHSPRNHQLQYQSYDNNFSNNHSYPHQQDNGITGLGPAASSIRSATPPAMDHPYHPSEYRHEAPHSGDSDRFSSISGYGMASSRLVHPSATASGVSRTLWASQASPLVAPTLDDIHYMSSSPPPVMPQEDQWFAYPSINVSNDTIAHNNSNSNSNNNIHRPSSVLSTFTAVTVAEGNNHIRYDMPPSSNGQIHGNLRNNNMNINQFQLNPPGPIPSSSSWQSSSSYLPPPPPLFPQSYTPVTGSMLSWNEDSSKTQRWVSQHQQPTQHQQQQQQQPQYSPASQSQYQQQLLASSSNQHRVIASSSADSEIRTVLPSTESWLSHPPSQSQPEKQFASVGSITDDTLSAPSPPSFSPPQLPPTRFYADAAVSTDDIPPPPPTPSPKSQHQSSQQSKPKAAVAPPTIRVVTTATQMSPYNSESCSSVCSTASSSSSCSQKSPHRSGSSSPRSYPSFDDAVSIESATKHRTSRNNRVFDNPRPKQPQPQPQPTLVRRDGPTGVAALLAEKRTSEAEIAVVNLRRGDSVRSGARSNYSSNGSATTPRSTSAMGKKSVNDGGSPSQQHQQPRKNSESAKDGNSKNNFGEKMNDKRRIGSIDQGKTTNNSSNNSSTNANDKGSKSQRDGGEKTEVRKEQLTKAIVVTDGNAVSETGAMETTPPPPPPPLSKPSLLQQTSIANLDYREALFGQQTSFPTPPSYPNASPLPIDSAPVCPPPRDIPSMQEQEFLKDETIQPTPTPEQQQPQPQQQQQQQQKPAALATEAAFSRAEVKSYPPSPSITSSATVTFAEPPPAPLSSKQPSAVSSYSSPILETSPQQNPIPPPAAAAAVTEPLAATANKEPVFSPHEPVMPIAKPKSAGASGWGGGGGYSAPQPSYSPIVPLPPAPTTNESVSPEIDSDLLVSVRGQPANPNKPAGSGDAAENEDEPRYGRTTRSGSIVPATATPEEEVVLRTLQGRAKKGTPVHQNHSMYSFTAMMTHGIRTAVERCGVDLRAKSLDSQTGPDLSIDMFTAVTNDVFDMGSDSNTAFRFKDYAPGVFHHLRKMFGVDANGYLASCCGSEPLTQLGTPGKSGQLFYFTPDGRYMVKTVTKAESKLLQRILPQYYQHCCKYKNTMLCRFFGLHRIQPQNAHIVVMGNVFDTDRVIHERYDLKGSTQGRAATEAQRRDRSVILKDLDFLEMKRRINIGPRRKQMLIEQLRIDSKMLAQLNVMDYSLLLGIHFRDRPRPKDSNPKSPAARPDRRNRRKSLVFQEATYTSIFQCDAGGLASLAPDGEEAGNEVYFMAVIDILQRYNVRKQLETNFKGIRYSKNEISSVHPEFYAQRFVNFMDSLIT